VLETTGDFRQSPRPRLTALAVSRQSWCARTFGYSFSTWPGCHLRGQTIRSANDVGFLPQA